MITVDIYVFITQLQTLTGWPQSSTPHWVRHQIKKLIEREYMHGHNYAVTLGLCEFTVNDKFSFTTIICYESCCILPKKILCSRPTFLSGSQFIGHSSLI